jgi:hypothetical protein
MPAKSFEGQDEDLIALVYFHLFCRLLKIFTFVAVPTVLFLQLLFLGEGTEAVLQHQRALLPQGHPAVETLVVALDEGG